MAKTFESNYGGGLITSAQYLAEIMCVRLAAKDGITLSNKFWEQPFWKREFKKQILAANALLRRYEIRAILNAINSYKTVYSLHAKWLDPKIQQAQLEIDISRELAKGPDEELAPVKPVSTDNTVRPQFKKKNVLDKLE